METDDFFADLMPSNGSAPPVSPFLGEDPVLPSGLDNSVSPSFKQHLSTSPSYGSSGAAPEPVRTSPMGEPKTKKELRDFEAVTEKIVSDVMSRFAGGLGKVLEDVSR